MPLAASILLFALFAINVGIGSSGKATFLTDVGEMLVLFAASICFVVAILRSEAAKKKRDGGA